MKPKMKRSWKMWGVIWPDGTLVRVSYSKSDAADKFVGTIRNLGLKIKQVTVTEGWNHETKS